MVSPSGNVSPLVWLQVTEPLMSPSSASVATTVKLTAAPALLVASAVMSFGRVSTGGVFRASSHITKATWMVTSACSEL